MIMVHTMLLIVVVELAAAAAQKLVLTQVDSIVVMMNQTGQFILLKDVFQLTIFVMDGKIV